MTKKSVSSRDVAKEAGVSQATVSYVLNNVQNVKIKPETRKAVMEAAKRLNYHPNYIAKGMKLNKSMSIGVVTEKNVTNFYFMKALEGIKDAIKKYNYAITLIFNKHEDIPEELTDMEFIKYYNSNRLDGIIFAFNSVDEEVFTYMNAEGIPFVMVDVNASGYDAYEVCTDLLDHMADIMDFFASKGVRNVGYAGPISRCPVDKRVERLKTAARNSGIEVLDKHIIKSSWDDTEINKAITGLLAGNERPQAIVAGRPRFGLYIAKCAAILDIKVPDELRIISLGSSNFYKLAHPSVSAVEVPLYEMGFKAAEKLFDIMKGCEVEKVTVLPSELVIRDSS